MKSREWATLGVLAIARVHGSTETTEPIPEGESAEDALRYKGGNIGALLRETTPSWQLIPRVWLAKRGMAIPMTRGLPR